MEAEILPLQAKLWTAGDRGGLLESGKLSTVSYKYYNMDQVVAQALNVFERLKGERRTRTEKLQEERIVRETVPLRRSVAAGADGRKA